MQQSQIVGIGILGGCEKKIVYTDNKVERNQDQSLPEASQTMQPALLNLTGAEDEILIPDKLQNHPNYVPFREKPYQLVGEATVPDSVVSSCRINKYGPDLLRSLKRALNVLREQNCLVYG